MRLGELLGTEEISQPLVPDVRSAYQQFNKIVNDYNNHLIKERKMDSRQEVQRLMSQQDISSMRKSYNRWSTKLIPVFAELNQKKVRR